MMGLFMFLADIDAAYIDCLIGAFFWTLVTSSPFIRTSSPRKAPRI
jgi:hypothetical protein